METIFDYEVVREKLEPFQADRLLPMKIKFEIVEVLYEIWVTFFGNTYVFQSNVPETLV